MQQPQQNIPPTFLSMLQQLQMAPNAGHNWYHRVLQMLMRQMPQSGGNGR